MVMYMSVYVGVLFTTDETGVHIQCILHPWLYVLGYLLAFGTVLAKMWRVYHIFHNPMPKMKMKDWHLVLMALGVTAIGIVLLVIRSGLQVSPPQLVRDNENREGRTVRVRAYSLDVFIDSRGHMFCLLGKHHTVFIFMKK